MELKAPTSQSRSIDDPDFGVYIHWPFCAQKCPYCDFNSHVRHGEIDQSAFLAAYKQEMATVRALIGPRAVTSIFFGGGTPSLMQADIVAALIDEIASLWSLNRRVEITLEANPNSVEAERFRAFRSAGINRVSIGVQALRDGELKRLGRLHTVEEAKKAVSIAEKTFDRFSFDLIYARPHQTVEDWRQELREALRFGAKHLSLYQLTIEAGTPFAALFSAGKLAIPSDSHAAALFETTQKETLAAGLPNYETSNHAAKGEESQHNLTYWRYGSYAGIGPGAQGRLPIGEGVSSDANAPVRLATNTERMPEVWATHVKKFGHGFTEQVPVSRIQAADEMLLMGLRLREGINLDRLANITGLRPCQSAINALLNDELIQPLNDDVVATTNKGRLLVDKIVLALSESLCPVIDEAEEAELTKN